MSGQTVLVVTATQRLDIGMVLSPDQSGGTFARIGDIITNAELVAMSEAYKRVAGFERESLARRGSLV